MCAKEKAPYSLGENSEDIREVIKYKREAMKLALEATLEATPRKRRVASLLVEPTRKTLPGSTWESTFMELDEDGLPIVPDEWSV